MKQDDIDAMLAGLDEPEPTPARKAEAAPAEDVLELTEAMQAPASFRKIDATQDVVFDERELAPPRLAEPPRAAPAPPPEAILSPATAAAVDSAFNALAQTVLVQNANESVAIAFVAMAQTVPVLIGGLDLSVGAVMTLASCVASELLSGTPVEIVLGMVATLAAGFAMAVQPVSAQRRICSRVVPAIVVL